VKLSLCDDEIIEHVDVQQACQPGLRGKPASGLTGPRIGLEEMLRATASSGLAGLGEDQYTASITGQHPLPPVASVEIPE